MEEYKPNSHKYKQEQKEKQEQGENKKLDKVISGTAKVKKKTKTSKFAEAFISEDARNVKSYIVSDVLIPAAKKLISDIVKDGIEMILYGGSGHSRRSDGIRANYVSYNRFADRRDDRRLISDSRVRSSYSYDDVILETRGDAEEVLDAMDDIIDTYGMASIADLYELVGITGQFTDNNYGWTNLRNAEPVRTSDGYMLKLPRAIALRK